MSNSAGVLASFALTILRVVVNQAGCERVFSDVKNTESPRRSRTGLARLEKVTKVFEWISLLFNSLKNSNQVNASIKAEHLATAAAAAVPGRQKRKNHKSVEQLLAVPRYRDLLADQDDEDDTEHGRALVSSDIVWRAELAKWKADAQAAEIEAEEDESLNSDDEVIEPTPRLTQPKVKKWVKTSLAVLFGGAKKKPVTKIPQADLDQEAELMEALAEAEEDARPNDGAIEQSEDEYKP